MQGTFLYSLALLLVSLPTAILTYRYDILEF